MSRSSRKKTARQRRPRIPASEVRGRPWVIDGIDYGPAIAAAADLSRWALDLATAEVADWPEGRRRVRDTSPAHSHRPGGAPGCSTGEVLDSPRSAPRNPSLCDGRTKSGAACQGRNPW